MDTRAFDRYFDTNLLFLLISLTKSALRPKFAIITIINSKDKAGKWKTQPEDDKIKKEKDKNSSDW